MFCSKGDENLSVQIIFLGQRKKERKKERKNERKNERTKERKKERMIKRWQINSKKSQDLDGIKNQFLLLANKKNCLCFLLERVFM